MISISEKRTSTSITKHMNDISKHFENTRKQTLEQKKRTRTDIAVYKKLVCNESHIKRALKMLKSIRARIASIIESCCKHKIPIRWFDHLPFKDGLKPQGGDSNFFTPVNAIEVTISDQQISLEMMLMALVLTYSNLESLVFLRHATESEPGVLFTADSPLRTKEKPFPCPTGLPKPDKRLLVTAPHHGSKSNTAAYSVLSNWLGSNYPPLFVQNGGRSVKKTADEFKKARDHQCVRCINSPLPPNLVQYKARKNSWDIPSPMSPPCTCP